MRCQRHALLFLSLMVPPASLIQATAAAANELKLTIDNLLEAERPQIDYSIQIVRLSDNKILYDHEAERALNPASNTKLVTEATALRYLGSGFRFRTKFSSQTTPHQGVIEDMWIKGCGDPLLITEELAGIVRGIRAAGVRRIRGTVYYDTSFFDAQSVSSYVSGRASPTGASREYRIVTSPLSFNFNTVEIQAAAGSRGGVPPLLTLTPPNRYLQIINQAKTGGGRRASLSVHPDGDSRLIVRGQIPAHSRGLTFRAEVNNPPAYAAGAILEALQTSGINFDGPIRAGGVPPEATLLYEHQSPPLHEVLKALGKFSNNFAAEQLLKTLGALVVSEPGSTQKGAAVMQAYLDSLKIPRHSYRLENGSGLTLENRLSAAQIITILSDMYHSALRDDFISSLSISGIDGTIRRRFKRSELRGQVVAKTGSLSGVVALSGYWLSAPGGSIAFSILMNGRSLSFSRGAQMEEKVLTALAHFLEVR